MQKLEILLWVEGKLTLNIDCREVIMGRLWRSEPRLLKQERKKEIRPPIYAEFTEHVMSSGLFPGPQEIYIQKRETPTSQTAERRIVCQIISRIFASLNTILALF